MPTEKIADLPKHETCLDREHNPPNMRVYPNGVYKHTCSSCGHTTTFRIYNPTC